MIILTGAGMSAESGLKTFRDADGLWEGHDVMEVASPVGWARDRIMVLDFYNQRRRQLKEVEPNAGHKSLVKLEEKYEVIIITQNVDDLHERAGSAHVIHLHGELLKVRSTGNPSYVLDWDKDLNNGDQDPEGYQMRPDIVWFGEAVPLIQTAAELVSTADKVIIVGTSLQVYPAAGLVGYAPRGAAIYYIDPRPATNYELEMRATLTTLAKSASVGVPELVRELLA